jgi:hypothetical protein
LNLNAQSSIDNLIKNSKTRSDAPELAFVR